MAIFDLRGRVLRAVNDKVVVLKASRPGMSKGGIVLPAEDVRTYCEGKVLSVGPEVKSCKAGDDIIWQVFKGQAAGHHDEDRWCIEDKDVMAVIEPAQASESIIDHYVRDGAQAEFGACGQKLGGLHVPSSKPQRCAKCRTLMPLELPASAEIDGEALQPGTTIRVVEAERPD